MGIFMHFRSKTKPSTSKENWSHSSSRNGLHRRLLLASVINFFILSSLIVLIASSLLSHVLSLLGVQSFLHVAVGVGHVDR